MKSRAIRFALLLAENYGVNALIGSPVGSAREFLDRVKRSPDTYSFGVSGVGGSNHVSLVSALARAGIAPRTVRIASFAGGGPITLALLGGHVDAIHGGSSNMVEHPRTGRMRTERAELPRRTQVARDAGIRAD